jgi:hypothetical protein
MLAYRGSFEEVTRIHMHRRVAISLRIFLSSTAPSAYEGALKSSSSVIIPTPVLERDSDKYNNNNNIHNNNNNNINNNISLTSNSSSNAVALKIEEVSNETSNLIIEDRQNNTTTRWIKRSTSFHEKKIQISFLIFAAHRPRQRQIQSEMETANRRTATWPS